MTKKDIEKGAKKQLKGIVPCEWNQEPFIDIFVRAANWRINSVWHDVSECPNENEPTIIERTGNKFGFHEKGYDGPWKYNVKQFGFKRWAYIKDLIPNKED